MKYIVKIKNPQGKDRGQELFTSLEEAVEFIVEFRESAKEAGLRIHHDYHLRIVELN